MWWNLRQFNVKQLFIHKPDLVRSPLTRDNVTAIECCGDSCKSTLVVKRKADILSTSYDISIHQ